jgi:hypothetical protein
MSITVTVSEVNYEPKFAGYFFIAAEEEEKEGKVQKAYKSWC